jgi:MraZ protein
VVKSAFTALKAGICNGEFCVFQGPSSLSLDAKGRLSVPTRHRDVLVAVAAGALTITRHPHGCLMIDRKSVV